MCLHDELLVHVPAEHADAVAALVEASLQEAAAYWHPGRAVRFVAEASVIDSWAHAK
jgi:DNA polymerase I